MKRLVLIFMLAALILSSCACSSSSTASGSVPSSSYAESKLSSEVDKPFELILPSEHDTIAKPVRMFLEAVKSYDLNDFSTTESNVLLAGKAPVPLMIKWDAASDFKPDKVTVYISENENMDNAYVYDFASSKSLNIDYLKTGTVYYVKAVATVGEQTVQTKTHSVKTAEGPRLFSTSGCGISNLRDMGGWATTDGKLVKQGLIFRSAKYDGITELGKSLLTQTLGIKTEIDFRWDHEIEDEALRKVSPIGEDIKRVRALVNNYAEAIGSKTTTEAMKVFADWSNYPVLFHCAGGADRTGTIALFLNGLLGVDERSLIADYELTPERPRNYGENGANGGFSGLWQAVQKYDGKTMQEKCYNLLLDHKLTDMELSNIYNIMLTDSAVFDASSLEKQAAENGKLTYKLIMRESKSVSKIEIDGKSAKFTLSGDTLTVNASGSGVGIITLDDGAVLRFKF